VRQANGSRRFHPEEQDEILENSPEIREDWDDEHGDRGTRLVLIGTDMDHDGLRTRLEDCVLEDDEMEEDWTGYEDRFPEFVPVEQEEEEEAHEHEKDATEEVGIAD